MATRTQQENDADGARKDTDSDADRTNAEKEAEALNDARALQQMIEGTPDASDEFRRIEQKR